MPFILVVVLGLIGGALLDIYSSGLSLLAAGLRVPRPVAATIDGTLMVIGTIAVVFFADSFIGPFQGFLITLGVPIAAWCGVMLADIALRKRDYAEPELFDPRGRYGSVQPVPLALLVVGTVLGWGLVTNTFAGWLDWQGYLLEPFGLGGKDGAWAYANLGVLVAFLIGLLGTLALRRSAVRAQETLRPVTAEGWLVVVDLQHVFGDEDSPWAAPRFARDPARGSRQLAAAFGDRVVWTRFVAPGRARRGVEGVLRAVPVRAPAAGRPALPAGGRPRRAPGRRRDHVRQVGPRPGRGRRRGPADRRRRGHRLLRDLHRPARGRRRRRRSAWSAMPAPAPATTTTSARCG